MALLNIENKLNVYWHLREKIANDEECLNDRKLLDLDEQIYDQLHNILPSFNCDMKNEQDIVINKLLRAYEGRIILLTQKPKESPLLKKEPKGNLEYHFMPPEEESPPELESELSSPRRNSLYQFISVVFSTIVSMIARICAWGIETHGPDDQKTFVGKPSVLEGFFLNAADIHFEEFIVQKHDKNASFWRKGLDSYYASFGDGQFYKGSKDQILDQLCQDRDQAEFSGDSADADRIHGYAIKFEAKITDQDITKLTEKHKNWRDFLKEKNVDHDDIHEEDKIEIKKMSNKETEPTKKHVGLKDQIKAENNDFDDEVRPSC